MLSGREPSAPRRCLGAGKWPPVSLLPCWVQAEAKAAGELVTDNVEVQRMMQQAGKVGNPAGGAHSGCRGCADLLTWLLRAAHADLWLLQRGHVLMSYCLGCWLQCHKGLLPAGSTLHTAD